MAVGRAVGRLVVPFSDASLLSFFSIFLVHMNVIQIYTCGLVILDKIQQEFQRNFHTKMKHAIFCR